MLSILQYSGNRLQDRQSVIILKKEECDQEDTKYPLLIWPLERWSEAKPILLTV
jgi:hypothetical protein